MIYNIELSFSVFNSNILSNIIKNTAYECHCVKFNQDYEMDIERNKCVLHIQFENSEGTVLYFLSFIKIIKKIPDIYIETIYTDDSPEIQLLYASSYYLTTIDKHIASLYKLNKRKRSYSEDDSKIIHLLKK